VQLGKICSLKHLETIGSWGLETGFRFAMVVPPNHPVVMDDHDLVFEAYGDLGIPQFKKLPFGGALFSDEPREW